jgi:hypothetical protein
VLCQDKKLNYNGRYFFEDQGEKRRSSVSYGLLKKSEPFNLNTAIDLENRSKNKR